MRASRSSTLIGILEFLDQEFAFLSRRHIVELVESFGPRRPPHYLRGREDANVRDAFASETQRVAGLRGFHRASEIEAANPSTVLPRGFDQGGTILQSRIGIVDDDRGTAA